MDDLGRVKKVCKWLIYNDVAYSDKELSELLGYTKSSFSQIINGKVPLSDKFIDKLQSLDVNVNKVWIKTGHGSMFKTQPTDTKDESEVDYNTGNAPKIISLLERQVSLLEENKQMQVEKIAKLEQELAAIKSESNPKGNVASRVAKIEK